MAVASAVIIVESTVRGYYKASDGAGGFGSSPKFITSMSISSYCVMQPSDPVVVLLNEAMLFASFDGLRRPSNELAMRALTVSNRLVDDTVPCEFEALVIRLAPNDLTRRKLSCDE